MVFPPAFSDVEIPEIHRKHPLVMPPALVLLFAAQVCARVGALP